MRTNNKYNLPTNNFISNINKIYIDYTDKSIFKIDNHVTLQFIYKNERINKSISSLLFDSNTKYSGLSRITPLKYFNTGTWKLINDDSINDIYVDYPIKLVSPNKIIIESGTEQVIISKSKMEILKVFNNEDYELKFDINVTFQENESFKVYLLPVSSKENRMFCITDNLIYDTNTKEYSIKFNTSIFYDKRYTFQDNNYFIALQSNNTSNIYLSNPSRYIFITKDKQFKLIDFKLNTNKLY